LPSSVIIDQEGWVDLICTKCGYSNKESSRFCIKCGQKLQASPPVSPSASGHLNVGSLLQGRYKILKQIGKGGMGVVHLASDNRFSNRVCVVKEMLEYLTHDSDEEKQKALLRFNQEADLLAEINHANVPQVYDRFSEGRRHYLVMEFIAGIDLKVLLDEYLMTYGIPLPEEDIVVYFMQLCLTLKYLHAHQPPIFHRDIKPPNILLTKEGKIKLVDFGIAKTIQTKKAGTSIGTQGYAAPEQYKGFADQRTDIYALGATMHHLLTGRDPQQQAPFDYPPVKALNNNISEDLSNIIEWMLQMNIESRPQNMDAIINAVKSIYPDIEQKMLNYSIVNKIFSIVNTKLAVNSDALVKNVCKGCGHQNNSTSRFCIKCGTPLERSGSLSGGINNTGNKMIVHKGSKILSKYPEGYSDFVKISDKSGEIKLNVILGRCMQEGAEYVYITEKLPSIEGREVIPYLVVRNAQGAMQYMKPVTDHIVKAKLQDYWLQMSG
jgi:serine/threonine protein kinase